MRGYYLSPQVRHAIQSPPATDAMPKTIAKTNAVPMPAILSRRFVPDAIRPRFAYVGYL